MDYFAFTVKPVKHHPPQNPYPPEPDPWALDDGSPPTLDDLTIRRADLHPDYAWTVRAIAKVILSYMGCGDDDILPRPQFYAGYRETIGLPGSGSIRFGGRDDIHIDLPGKACQAIGENLMRNLMRRVRATGHATRIDLAIDDFTKAITPSAVALAYREGCGVTRARKWVYYQSGEGPKGQIADTFYLGWQPEQEPGKRKERARQELMIEDKAAESRGEVDAIRWELRCRKDKANVLLSELVDSDDWPSIFITNLVSFVDFREPGTNKRNPERRLRVAWFQRLVSMMKRANSYARKPVQSLESAARWIRRSVAPTLAAVVDAGYDLAEVIEQGKRRWKARHHRLAEAWMPNRPCTIDQV